MCTFLGINVFTNLIHSYSYFLLCVWFNDYPMASTFVALANQNAHLLHGCEVTIDSLDNY